MRHTLFTALSRGSFSLAIFGLSFGLLGAATQHGFNAEAQVLQTEGISGDVDKKRRSPFLSVEAFYVQAGSEDAANGGPRGRILVDVFTQNNEYQQYPIRVDYYINRNFMTSQIRSTELPGALGIDIGPDKATPPFNYSIVATLLHPNREFTTVMHGAIYADSLRGGLERCALTLTDSQAGESNTYVAETLSFNQTGGSQYALSFESSELDDGSGADTVATSAVLELTNTAATGNLTTTVGDEAQTVAVTGTFETGDDGVSKVDVKSADGATILVCN